MKFSELAGYLDRLEATSSRNELVRILSELYRACSVDEIEPTTYLIQGRLAPFFEPVEIGLGERLLISAMAMAYGTPKDVFDIMFRDGSDLTPLPYEQRFAIVDELLKRSDTLQAAPLTKTDSVEVLTRELLDNISRGLEGVVAKRLDSPYQAGARNFNWVKLKRNTSGELTDTIDVVLIGYYRGKGKRAEFGAGALLAGVYDSDRDEFVSISKLGTGLSDEGWRELYKQVSALEAGEKPARVNSGLVPDVWLKPEVVVEVLADEITPSPRHTAGRVGDQPGFALRFPRIVSIRSADKKPEDATTVHEIREMFEQQRQRPVRE